MTSIRNILAVAFSTISGLAATHSIAMTSSSGLSASHSSANISSSTTQSMPQAEFREVPDAGHTDPVQIWHVREIRLSSSTDYSAHGADDIEIDVRFVHERTGEVLVRPAFWDGGNLFLVRFAPTLTGRWSWTTVCRRDASLHNLSGEFRCVPYRGELEIYRRGFVKAVPGLKYMTYADGTPFFYLGDTHWGMYTEELDEPGPHAGQSGAVSHFKHIVDRRVAQGFTVYQSEPIGSPFNLTDGHVDQADIEGFRTADMYYRYIADKGLVHANAEFFFSANMRGPIIGDDAALRRLARYWAARFGAFPVMWTLAQEVDNDFYAERSQTPPYDWTDNPWVRVAKYLHAADCYSHPLTAHQENAVHTSVTGKDVEFDAVNADGFGMSVFASDVVAWRTGHTFWAAQWSPGLTASPRPDMIWDYWTSSRPAVNYEGRYCNLWTKDFGSRAQGWISFLSGFCGYGYGAIDIWLYRSTYDIAQPSFDGVDSISVDDKLRHWSEAVEFESARQMIHLRRFMEGIDWYRLRPVLPRDSAFAARSEAFVCARTPAGTHVMYFYARNRKTGTLLHLRPMQRYDVQFFNPRSGASLPAQTVRVDAEGNLELPQKPDELDWTVTVSPRR